MVDWRCSETRWFLNQVIAGPRVCPFSAQTPHIQRNTVQYPATLISAFTGILNFY